MDAYQCMAPNRNPFEREPHRRSCSSTSLQHLPDAWKAAGMDVPLAPVPLAPVEQLVHTARADDSLLRVERVGLEVSEIEGTRRRERMGHGFRGGAEAFLLADNDGIPSFQYLTADESSTLFDVDIENGPSLKESDGVERGQELLTPFQTSLGKIG